MKGNYQFIIKNSFSKLILKNILGCFGVSHNFNYSKDSIMVGVVL